MRLAKFLLSLMLSSWAVAHPGHAIREELEERSEFLATHTNNLNHCASVHRADGLGKRSEDRRAARLDELLRRRGLSSMARDLDT